MQQITAKNFILTCRPITLWPAFSFPASKLRACFSAYLTPISIVVWKPLVFAYFGRRKIEYSVFEAYFLSPVSKPGLLQAGLSPWDCVRAERCTSSPHHLKVALQSYPSQKDILQGLVLSCEPALFCVCTWKQSETPIRNPHSEL